ncbi:MAG: hypothetical protein N2112_08320 [Gemmataceae bacterium]|jgi:hypothetical protein|nr:hypothetical protein [Gemmataceae bacterium]
MNVLFFADGFFAQTGRSILVFLAAVGAFLIGHVLIGLIIGLICKMNRKKVPEVISRMIRFIGGLACAVLIWELFSGTGGFGLGGGGEGNGEGKNENQGQNLPISIPNVTPPKEEKKEEPKEPKKSDTTTITWVKIVVLGGSRPEAMEKRFYEIQNESAVTLEKAKEKLAELKRQNPKLVSYTIPPGGAGHAGKGTSVYEDIEKVAEELGLKFIDYKVVQPNTGN